jgi:methionyl-tRNA synthetase
VNDVPHLGSAYTTIAADALRRYHLVRGHDARMLTGTDEHGQKMEREAQERGIPTKQLVDEISQRFREAWPHLDIQYDDFVRTTEPRHMEFVQELWKKIDANGDIYLGFYEDWYCVGCESFKTEKELLPGNQCPLHPGKAVDRLKEETYFFRLSKYQPILQKFYAKRPSFIEPATRRNEVLAFVEGGLKDLSVSRTSFSWGIPVPGNPKHVMFVWFDALTNYRSVLGHGPLTRYWPPSGKAYHLVGKDILRFHTVYWPAFLLAAGYPEEALPTQVFVHGWLTVDGQKMSKSLRNAVDPLRLARELGPDVVRYHLMRAIAFGQDGDFDHAALLERYNADLGKNLGNLLSRTLGLCGKFPSGKPRRTDQKRAAHDEELLGLARARFADAAQAWDELQPHRALEATWEICAAANQYVDRAAPWNDAKNQDFARLETTLATLLAVLERVSVMIWPVMPKKADEMRAQLGLAKLATKLEVDQWPAELGAPHDGALGAASALFPVIDKDREKALLERLVPKAEAPKAEAPKAAESAGPISYDQFATVDLRVGVVKTAEKVPKKDKLLRLSVDLGEAEPRQIVAGLALSFTPEQLVGRRIVVVANLAPRDFGKGLVSHGMLLASGPSEKLVLATVDADAPPGARLK